MKKEISIYIGGLYISKEPSIIRTILGSCISVCLYDPENRIGGMNHFLLPEQLNNKDKEFPTKYGINAMELLINGIMELGGKRGNLVSKVFGGARLFAGKYNMKSPGDNNYKFVPVEYRIYSPKVRIYKGNLPFFNQFDLQYRGGKRRFYTIFFDKWIQGKKGDFHWKNSRAYDFSYNLTHPIEGVVQSLESKPISESVIVESISE